MTASLIGFAGWVGAACMLLAYALLSTRRIPAGLAFQTLNFGGAFGLLLNGASHRAWPSVLLNLAWLLLSSAALARQRRRHPDRLRAVTGPVAEPIPRQATRRARRFSGYRDPVAAVTPRIDRTAPNWIEARTF